MVAVDADVGNGELTIKLPPETFAIIAGKNNGHCNYGQTMAATQAMDIDK